MVIYVHVAFVVCPWSDASSVLVLDRMHLRTTASSEGDFHHKL
jgi:hypothetical protein